MPFYPAKDDTGVGSVGGGRSVVGRAVIHESAQSPGLEFGPVSGPVSGGRVGHCHSEHMRPIP